MTTRISQENTSSRSIILLRKVALFAAITGAIGSLGWTLFNGRHNNSVFLIALFALWVPSPFLALLVAYRIAEHWSEIARRTLFRLMMVIALGSLLGYANLFTPANARPAFIFLMVPLLSWLLMLIVIPFAVLLSRRKDRP